MGLADINKKIAVEKRKKAKLLASGKVQFFIAPHHLFTATDMARQYFAELSEPEIRKLAEVIASKFQEVENLVAQYSQEAVASSKPENLDKWFAENYVLGIDLTIQKRSQAS